MPSGHLDSTVDPRAYILASPSRTLSGWAEVPRSRQSTSALRSAFAVMFEDDVEGQDQEGPAIVRASFIVGRVSWIQDSVARDSKCGAEGLCNRRRCALQDSFVEYALTLKLRY